MEDKKVTIDLPISTIVRVIIALGITGLVLLVKDVIILIVLSFVFATSVRPIVDTLNKKKIPRSLAIIALFTLLGSVLYFVIKAIVPPVAAQITEIINNREHYISVLHESLRSIPFLSNQQLSNLFDSSLNGLTNFASGGALSGALGVFSGIIGFVTVLILSFYFLLDKKGIEHNIPNYFNKEHSKRLLRVYNDISKKMTYWFWGQIGVASIIGIMSFIGLTILGVKFALTLALIATVTSLIPIIGPFIAALAAIGVALTISPSKAVAVAVLYLLIQFAESHFITPNIMKKALGVSPAIVIIAILLGSKLFGFIGIVLALPLAAIISVVIDEMYKINKEEEKVGN